MSTLTVIIERTENNFSAYVQEVDGIAATGNSIDETKGNIVSAIKILVDDCKEYGGKIPAELAGDYQLSFKIDDK